MPCRCDYMEANAREIALSRACCLWEELTGKRKTINKSHWDGYHPDVYSRNIDNETGDLMVARLCEGIQKVDPTKYSLELQTWWRDHQASDRQRSKDEAAVVRNERARQRALAKLSPKDRAVLGLD